MSTPRDRRESPPLDLSPQRHACPAGHHAWHERSHQPRWSVRRDQPVNVVSPVLEGGTPACAQRAVGYRPHQQEAWALRGSTCGLDVVARLGEWRYRDHVASTQMRAQLQIASPVSRSRPAGALWGEVLRALGTTVASQDHARVEPWST